MRDEIKPMLMLCAFSAFLPLVWMMAYCVALPPGLTLGDAAPADTPWLAVDAAGVLGAAALAAACLVSRWRAQEADRG